MSHIQNRAATAIAKCATTSISSASKNQERLAAFSATSTPLTIRSIAIAPVVKAEAYQQGSAANSYSDS